MDREHDIPVTFTDGVFRPDERIDLPEGSRLNVALPDQNQPTAETRKRGWDVIQRLRSEKLIKLVGLPWSREELYDRR